jgi:hypothetical protein
MRLDYSHDRALQHLTTTSPVSPTAAGWATDTGDDHVVQMFWKNWNIFSRSKYEHYTVRIIGICITVDTRESLRRSNQNGAWDCHFKVAGVLHFLHLHLCS